MLSNVVTRLAVAVPACLLAVAAIAACEPAVNTEAASNSQETGTLHEALEGVNCTTVVPEVIALTDAEPVQMLDVYKPAVVKDQLDAFKAGQLTIPANKTMVEVLTCKGVASFSDQYEGRITYGVQVDEKNEIYIRWNA